MLVPTSTTDQHCYFLAELEALPFRVPPKQSVMFPFRDANSKHLCLIFIQSTVFLSELQNFRAPGPCDVKNARWRLA